MPQQPECLIPEDAARMLQIGDIFGLVPGPGRDLVVADLDRILGAGAGEIDDRVGVIVEVIRHPGPGWLPVEELGADLFEVDEVRIVVVGGLVRAGADQPTLRQPEEVVLEEPQGVLVPPEPGGDPVEVGPEHIQQGFVQVELAGRDIHLDVG